MFLSPRTAHRTVGYLEEAAHRAYSEYLEAVDEGHIPNVPAGDIARAYYRLPESEHHHQFFFFAPSVLTL